MEVINSSQVDAWTEAAKAKGGVQRVWVRSDRTTPWDPWEVMGKRLKDCGVDVVDTEKGKPMEIRLHSKPIDISPGASGAVWQKGPSVPSAPSRVDQYEGRTFVENENTHTGILLEYVDPSAFEGSSLWASKAVNRGAAIHSFFYQETNFLEDAAKDYAVLEDNEVFRYRDIDDGSFIRNALDFFTDGHYTYKDEKELEYQMENVVMELSRMVRRGEKADVSKLQSKLMIAGAEVSVAELLEYQKVGKKVANSFLGANMGTLDSGKITQAAQVGIAKAMGNLYGSERGELGKLFSDGIDRLYDKAIANREKSAQYCHSQWSRVSSYDEALNLENDLVRLFAGMDTSSRASVTKSFQETVNRAKSAVSAYCYQYGGASRYNPYGSAVNLNKAVSQIQDFFQSWMDRIAQGA